MLEIPLTKWRADGQTCSLVGQSVCFTLIVASAPLSLAAERPEKRVWKARASSPSSPPVETLQGVEKLQSGGVQARRRPTQMLTDRGHLALALASYAYLRGAAFKQKHEG